MTIKITATAESVEQASKLLEAGIDTLYIGDADFALRVPKALTREDIENIVKDAHSAGKKVTLAVNAIMHIEQMAQIKPYLDFLQAIEVDKIAVGDAGVIYVLQRDHYQLPFTYDASTMVASARQVNFWAKQGAVEAVLARELPKPELELMAQELAVPGEILVYGATVIHHSKRPLLQNYFNFVKNDTAGKGKSAHHYLAEPEDAGSHYSIFEDKQGTHIFANDDVHLMTVLGELTAMGYDHWKLDGIFAPGDSFVEIVKLYAEARRLIEAGKFDSGEATRLDEAVRKWHPAGRTLSHGFYDLNPDEIK